uniref:Putative tail tape measure protein n=2 Tax=viral metagenome TaxID=1070528 RepID=A0A6M3K1I6_9ZZZZ
MATSTLASLVIRIGADVSGAVSKMTTVEKASRSLKKEFTGLSAATIRYRSAMVAMAGGAVLGLVIKNSMEAQRATAQLGAVLKSTGGVSGQTMASLDAMATALERTTIYGDEAVKSVQGLLLTFTRIKGGEFGQATQAVLDMATALGTDTKAAAIQVGKALQDPILGITALRKAGVNFSADQKAVIKDLVDTGRVAEAQAMILKELETEFGGSAEAARNTLGGAIAFLKNQLGNFFEVSESGSHVFINAINDMGDAVIWVRENAMVPFFGGIQEGAIDAAVAIAKLELAQAKFNRFLPGNLIRSAAGMPTVGADVAGAQANLDRMRQAAEGIRAAMSWDFIGPTLDMMKRGLGDVGDGADEAATKLKALLRRLSEMSVAAPSFMRFQGPSQGLSEEEATKRLQFMRGSTIFDLKPSVEAFKSSTDDMVDNFRGAKDRMLSAALMFRDGFADAVADAVMTGKLSFRSFADFVIRELIRIQVRGAFMQLLGAVAPMTSARAGIGGGASPMGVGASIGPGISMAPSLAPATVVNQTINFSVSAIDSRDAARFVHEQKGTIAGVVAEAARSSMGYRRALAGA